MVERRMLALALAQQKIILNGMVLLLAQAKVQDGEDLQQALSEAQVFLYRDFGRELRQVWLDFRLDGEPPTWSLVLPEELPDDPN